MSRGNISRLHVTWYGKDGNNQEKVFSSHNDSFAFTVQGTLADSIESHVVLYRCSVRNTDGFGSSPPAKLVVLRKGNQKRSIEEVSSHSLHSTNSNIWRRGGLMVSALVSRSSGLSWSLGRGLCVVFKSRSDHQLMLFAVAPSSTSRLRL